MPQVSLDQWNRFLQGNAEAHFLQTGEWGELKAQFGWEPVRLITGGVGAQVLFRRLLLGLHIAYIPKPHLGGAVSAGEAALWEEIDRLCADRHAIFCMVEPDEWMSDKLHVRSSGIEQPPGRTQERVSRQNIQPRRTVVVNLEVAESVILDRMRPKCRYNIRLAEKKGVTIEPWDDLANFHLMMRTTSDRDGFSVHSPAYYRAAFELFHTTGMCELLVAKYQDQPLAALLVFARGKRAWYVYGASTDEERNRMPNYLLQWEAMRWARERGCIEYDLWGTPDEDEPVLETNFERRSDGLWGVYRFKRGFGGELRRAAPAMDRVYRPWLYQLYLRGAKVASPG